MSNLIPDNFVPFLDSLRLKSLTSDANQISCLFPPISAVTALGTHLTKPAVNLYQMTPTEVTLTGFRKKLLQVLRSENHVANEEIVDAILGCVLGAATSGIDRVKFLDDLLSRFSNAEVSHFYILPLNAVMKPMKIEGYVLSEVDIGLLTSRANRAGSDFAKLYATGLKGRLCLQSPIFRHVVIDFIKLGLKHALLAQPSWRDLLLRYFERVARQHFEYMWSHLDRTQMLSTPFGAHILDAQNFRQGFAQFSKRISIYLDFSNSGAGYVVPEATDMEFNEPGPESIAYARYLEHRSNYRISEVGDSELGRTLYTCAGFCQQATRFLESGRNDDAALYATI